VEISQALSLQGQQFKPVMPQSQFMISGGLLLTAENEDGYKRKKAALELSRNKMSPSFMKTLARQSREIQEASHLRGKSFSLHSYFCKYQGRNFVEFPEIGKNYVFFFQILKHNQ